MAMPVSDLAAFSFCLSTIQRTVPSAWIQHTPFALFMIHALRPRLVVELGTHSGVSYCAFCQAINALGLDAEAFAVDTWEGDIHTGHYDHSVLNDLRCYHDLRYGTFSTLLQSTFEEALPRFQDGAIDLLHIDGLHTYDAVSRDFNTWLPKLSPRAVVLFHDTQVKDFGVGNLWKELQGRYPSFEFTHGYGLGVLGVGDELPNTVTDLFNQDKSVQEHYRTFFHQLGQRVEEEASYRQATAVVSASYQQQIEQLQHSWSMRIEQLRHSWSMRVGRLVTAPARMLRRLAA
jgi:hypothetical protein